MLLSRRIPGTAGVDGYLALAAQFGWRWLLLGLLRFFGLALLSLGHDRSPRSDCM